MEESKQQQQEEEGTRLGLDEEEEEDAKDMTPWEQHSAVISIPRFDYNAPSSLMEHSHSGFLITCPIKREKSATKEAISILSKYVGSFRTHSSESTESSDAEVDLKRRKIVTEEIGQECVPSVDSKETNGCGEVSKETTSSVKMDASMEKGLLSLVKLTRSGLLLFTFPRDNSVETTDVVSGIFHSLKSGTQKPLNWCNRIFPIQATCRLNEEDLREVVSKLVQHYVDYKQNKQGPVKFAVAYNRRGVDEKELNNHKNDSKYSNLLLDRNKCFGLVASVVKGIISNSTVDLKSPEFAVMVELLPLSRIGHGCVAVAVSVVPRELVNTKPKLTIKPLVPDNTKK